MLTDCYGLSVSTSSRAALDHYDRGVRGLLGFGGSIVSDFRAAVDADPEFAVAEAGLAVGLFLEEKLDAVRPVIERARARAETLPDRERRHVQALDLMLAGKVAESGALIRDILAGEPRELLLAQRLYFFLFWQGRAADMLALARSLVEASPDDSYAIGLLAFALEENRQFDEALRLAERALELNAQDAWAVHAYAHTLYETGENDQGAATVPPRMQPCTHLGYFRNHLAWHIALMHLAAGRYEHAGRMFTTVFQGRHVAVSSDMHDSVALAWRLDLFGHPDPARWAHVGGEAARRAETPMLLFHDVHVAMGLAAAGLWPAAERQLERLRERGKNGKNPTLPEVGVPLIEGVHAFARGEHAEAFARMAPIEARFVEIGGSNAQREVFHDTVLAAALRAGRVEEGTARLERRLAKRPNPGHYWSTLRTA